jgi:8-oxo-dGTP pyrophosphatase MutT (NUDIX family)
MSNYYDVASIILVNKDRKFILQRRDDKPGIRNPGMLTAWGGAAEGDERPIDAAVREMKEETNLNPTEEDFQFFGEYKRQYKINNKQVVNHVFILDDIDERSLKVFEGQDYQIIDPKSQTSDPLFTDLTKEIIRDFNQRAGQSR